MKYLINEEQNDKLKLFVEKQLNNYLSILQTMDDDNIQDWVHFGSPDTARGIDKIFVKDLTQNENGLSIVVDLFLSTFFVSPDIDFVFDSIFSQLEPHLGKINYVIDNIEKPNKDW